MKYIEKIVARTQVELKSNSKNCIHSTTYYLRSVNSSRYYLKIGYDAGCGTLLLIILNQNKLPIGYVDFSERKKIGRRYMNVVSVAYMMFAYRGLGLVSSAYIKAAQKTKEIIASDSTLSDAGHSLWKKIIENTDRSSLFIVEDSIPRPIKKKELTRFLNKQLEFPIGFRYEEKTF